MILRYLPLAVAAIVAVVSPAHAVVIVNETFDYSDDAAMHANWGGNPGTGAVAGTPQQVEERFQLTDVLLPNADFNADGNIDARDYVVWRNNRTATGPDLQPRGDANYDQVVNQHDYRAWKSAFGQAPPTGTDGKALVHLANTNPISLPDGNVVWKQPLDPGYFDGSIYPTEEEPIVVRGDIYVASGATQRNTIGLRYDNPAANLLELGLYNGNMKGVGIRVQLWGTSGGGVNPDWQYFEFDPSFDIDDRFDGLVGGGAGSVTWSEIFERFGPAWHEFEMTITETSVLATIDLLDDGLNNATGEEGVDATLSFDTGIMLGEAGFNSLRLGGPSQLGTTVEAKFDNIFLSGPRVPVEGGSLVTAAVPEPATWALGLFAGLVCLAASRRRV